MADPTIAEIKAVGTAIAKLWWDNITDMDGDVAQFDAIEQILEGDYIPAGVAAGLEVIRDAWGGAVSPAIYRSLMDAVWMDFGKLISAPETEVNIDLLTRIKRWMHEQGPPVTINRRDITFNACAAGGSNVGTGTIARCTVDEEDYTLDAEHLELKTAECVSDQNTGEDINAEVFEFRGIERTKGFIGYVGSGAKESFYVHNAGTGNGGSLLGNSSFDTTIGTAGTDQVSRWTCDANFAQITQETTIYHQKAPGSSQHYSLHFSGDAQISQALTVNNIEIDPNVPYMLQVAWRNSASGVTGNLVTHCGTQNTTSTFGSQANTNWHLHQMTIDKGLYYRNFKEAAADILIDVNTLAVGTVYIDSAILAPMDFFDGTYFWLSAHATAFLRRDVFTWTDALGGSDGRLAKFFWWLRYGSFPSATGAAETWADPA